MARKPLNEPEYVAPKAVDADFDAEHEKYIIVDSVTREPALTANGKRMDGGGHDSADKAVRQAGYINDGLRKKAKDANG